MKRPHAMRARANQYKTSPFPSYSHKITLFNLRRYSQFHLLFCFISHNMKVYQVPGGTVDFGNASQLHHTVGQ